MYILKAPLGVWGGLKMKQRVFTESLFSAYISKNQQIIACETINFFNELLCFLRWW